MEALFESETLYTGQIVEEMAKATVPKWYRVFCFAAAAFFFGWGVYGLATIPPILYLKNWLLLLIPFVGCAAILLFVLWWQPRDAVKRWKRLNQDGETQIRFRFGEEALKLDAPPAAGEIVLPYVKLRRLKETGRLCLLFFEGSILAVDKTRFIKGSYPEWLSFVKEKCPYLH